MSRADMSAPVEALELRVLMAADVVVNEIMYQATSLNGADEWIELYNRGDAPASLSGWKITKGVNYAFAGGTLNPGGYLVVAADAAKFHANFPAVTNYVGGWTGTLSNSQEKIQVEDGGGNVVDSVTYSDQGEWAKRRRGVLDNNHQGWDWVQPASGGGSSLELINPALTNNEGQNWGTSSTAQGAAGAPTPGAANSIFSSNVAPLILDVKQNILIPTSTNAVTISAKILDEAGAPASAQVMWRVSTSNTNTAFAPIAMNDAGTGGDATAGDGVWSGTIPAQANAAVVEFYVKATDATNKSRTWPAPSDDLGGQAANALYQVDNAPVVSGTTPVFRLIMSVPEQTEFNTILNSDVNSNARMNTTFIAVDTAGSQIRYLTGTRNRGHGSRSGTPHNFHVDFAADNPWKDKKSTNFNARTPFDQVLGSAIWRTAGFMVPDIIPAQLLWNGAAPTGSSTNGYALVEEPDSTYAASHSPDDANGNYYAAYRLDSGVDDADFKYLGTDPAPYAALYDKKTNADVNDYSDLIHMTDVLNNTPINSLLTEAKKVINLDEFLHYIALDNLLLNEESGLVPGTGDDFGMYRGEVDTRFRLVPHDLDTLMNSGSAGGNYNQNIFTFVDGSNPGVFTQNGMDGLKRLFTLPEVVQAYYKAYLDLFKTVYNPTVMNPLIDNALTGMPGVSAGMIGNFKTFVLNRTTGVLAQIPQQYQVTSTLPTVDGYRQTSVSAAGFTGTSNAALGQSVTLNGFPAAYNPRTGGWLVAPTAPSSGTATVSVISAGSTWKYLADGTDQGTAWSATGFNDNAWSSGPAQLGYGDGDEQTVLPVSPRVTTYFRKVFNVADKSLVTAMNLKLLRADGAVVYLNGNRIISSNMSTNAVNFQTQPNNNVPSVLENLFFSSAVSPTLLNNGSNVLAVELHNFTSGGSTDIGFDLSLDETVTTVTPSTGGVPLHPGVNRVTVKTFDGINGTGNVIKTSFVDVWYTGSNNGNFTRVDDLTLTVPDSYRPGTPFLVQVQANKNGQPQRDLWDATVTLSTDKANVTLSASTVTLRNGWGSVLVTPGGAGTASGSFTLSATLNNRVAQRTVTSLNGAAMTNVSGTLAAGNNTWSGIVRVTGNVTVPANATLTIAPGTLVLVDGVNSGLTTGAVITVNGKVLSQGTADRPVTITAIDPTKNWGGLSFASGTNASTFTYTQISKTGNTTGVGHTFTGPAVRSSSGTITFDHSAITDNLGKAGYLLGSSLNFLYSEVSRSRMGPELEGTALLFDHSAIFDNRGADDADGIYLHDQQPGQTITLQHGMIGAVDDDDIDTLASVVLIDDMVLRDAKDKAVSVLDGVVTVKNSLIAGNSLASEDATFSSISAKNLDNGNVATVNIDHTTIVANDPAGQGRDVAIESRNKYGLASGTINFNVTNSIIQATKPVNIEAPYTAATVNISYTDTFGTNWAGTGNLNVNPQFMDPSGLHDYHLRAGSPLVNAGNPAAAANDPDGSRADMGYALNGVAGARGTQTLAAGSLAAGVTILSPEGGPYTVTGNLVVPVGATLKILPGTSVYFAQDAGITVDGGLLLAEGTDDDRIRFTRVPGTSATWNGIQFVNTALDNRITYSVLEWGTAAATNNGMVGVSTSRVTLDHDYFDKSDRRRIRFNNASVVLTNSEFADIFGPGVAPTSNNFSENIWGNDILPGGQFLIQGNTFGTTKGHNDIIDIGSTVVATGKRPSPIFVIRDNVFNGGTDDGLDLEADALIEGNTFRNFIKDATNPDLSNGSVISAGGAGRSFTYTVVRNTFVNNLYLTGIKQGSFMNFVNNTVVNSATNGVTFEFDASDPAEAGQFGKGAYIDGNAFKTSQPLLASFTNTTQITVNRSVVPSAAYLTAYGTGNTLEDPRFVDAANGNYALRPGSPAKGTGPNGLDMGALVPQWASITGEPAALSGKTTATLTVGGPGIVSYKYRLNNGAYSAETPVATPIALSGLSTGQSYTVYVLARNDAGDWQDAAGAAPTASRTWTVNTTAPTVRVNEVLASNTTYLSNGGQFPDLIELFNTGTNAVDLSGMFVSDDPANVVKYMLPGGTTIAPGGYLTIYADSKTVAGQVHTGFGLSAGGEGVYLFDKNAAHTPIDGVAFGAQLDNLSIGRLADGSWALNQPTFGAANVARRTGDAATLKINEWNTAGLAPFNDDFIELFNPDVYPVAVGGYYLSNNPNPQPGQSQIPALTFVAANATGAGGFAVFTADGSPESGALHTNFSLPQEQGMIGLFDPTLTQVDKVLYLSQRAGLSQGRTPDGGNPFTFYNTPNPGLPNPGTVGSAVTLRVTELNFNPPKGTGASSGDYEFIELQNTATNGASVNLANVKISGAVDYTFAGGTLAAGAYVVIPANPTAFAARYGTNINLAPGAFTGNLDDNGGQIRVLDGAGATILDFGYSDAWQPTTDGDGDTLVVINPATAAAANWGLPSTWRASRAPLGTPGIDEDATLAAPPVIINEIMPNTAGNASDWIELRNTTGAAVNISNWYLSNDSANLLKYRLPANTIVPANGYLVLNQASSFGGAFSLAGGGGEVYLSSSATAGVLTGYRQGVVYGAADQGVSLGRFTTSTGAVDFTALAAATSGAANAAPRAGAVVISEIMYHPNGSATEYVELYNASARTVDLGGWAFTNGIDFTFPAGASIAPGAYVLVVPGDAATFRTNNAIPASVNVYGNFQGNLSNAGETLELSRPGVAEAGAPAGTPMVSADRVGYGTVAPWASAADGHGPSLERAGFALYGNDPANWTADSASSNPVGTAGYGAVQAAPTVAGSVEYIEAKTIQFVFSKDVAGHVKAADLTLLNRSTNQTIAGSSMSFAYDPATRTATWTAASGGTLPDGDYTATLNAAAIQDAAGLRNLDGNGNGAGGDNFTLNLYKFGGDANRDRTIDFNDLIPLAQNYNVVGGRTWATGDFTGDGTTDFNDLILLAQNYNTTPPLAADVPAPAATPLPAGAAALSFSDAWASVTSTTTTTPTPTTTPPPTKTPPPAKPPVVKPPAKPVPVVKPVTPPAKPAPKPVAKPAPAKPTNAPKATPTSVAPPKQSTPFSNTRVRTDKQTLLA